MLCIREKPWVKLTNSNLKACTVKYNLQILRLSKQMQSTNKMTNVIIVDQKYRRTHNDEQKHLIFDKNRSRYEIAAVKPDFKMIHDGIQSIKKRDYT